MNTINVGFRDHRSTRDTDKDTLINDPPSLVVVSHTRTGSRPGLVYDSSRVQIGVWLVCKSLFFLETENSWRLGVDG